MVFTDSLLGARLKSGSVLLVKANMLACYPLAKALNEIFRFGVIVKREGHAVYPCRGNPVLD